jgi:N-acetylglucosamine kinase-like BadF-type ATPase
VSRLFLGVDGGQSSTTALIGDESGRVIGMGRSGPCNQIASVGEAIAKTGAAGARFESAAFGFSGGHAGKEELTRQIVSADRYVFAHDALVALVGATDGAPGIVTIAGTGSIAFGRNASGKTARAGGWGYAFGDEGGAFDLVRQALRAVLRNEEGWGPRTALRDALLAPTGVADANTLLHLFYTDEYSRARIAGMANLIDESACAGDRVAHDILNSAAQSLATFAAAVRAQLFQKDEPVLIAHVGGVFKSEPIRERFRMLVELEAGNQVIAPKHGPAAGALIEAYRAASVEYALRDAPEEY